ncbi:MAG: PEGA domain-containing protein [Myxococcales bacterium]|nr:PEGA domain-containing protein [Myxococcales bacterium]
MNRLQAIRRVLWLGLWLLVTMPALAGPGGPRPEPGTRKPQVVAMLELPAEHEAQRSRWSSDVQRSLKARKVTAELWIPGTLMGTTQWPQPSQCTDSECQAELCQKSELRQLVSLRVWRDGDDWQLVGQLYDAQMADFAAEVSTSCLGCEPGKLGARLSGLTTELLHKAQQRKTGMLEVTSQPPGATVRLNGMRLGQTPLVVTTFAGEHRVEIQKPGFAHYQNEVVVEPGRGAALDALLVVEPGSPSGSEGQPRRARWVPLSVHRR